MSRTLELVRAGTYFDVLAAVFISLLVQMTMSLFAASVPVLAPAVAAERGWNPTIVAFYPIVIYVTAFLISFHIPELLFRMGGMGLSLASVLIGGAGLLLLLPPAVMGMPAAFVLAAASTLVGTALLAAPHRLFAVRAAPAKQSLNKFDRPSLTETHTTH